MCVTVRKDRNGKDDTRGQGGGGVPFAFLPSLLL